MFHKRSILTAFISLLLVAILAAACGNASTTTGSGSTPTTAPVTTPTTGSSAVVIKTTPETIDGKAKTVLTNAQGMTLYYNEHDTATTSSCSGGCASAWPPLLFSGSGTPSSATTLPGTLSVVNDVNGAQVEYQGHPLYTFRNDKSPGQHTGQDAADIWYVAATDLAPNGAGNPGAATPTPTKSSNGY